jgi:hypothetical protein
MHPAHSVIAEAATGLAAAMPGPVLEALAVAVAEGAQAPSIRG